ncbi:MAG: ribonuclease D [Proteobacteria bacterium]|nr:ribonuclease D [Pseudomonadota bacterium]
MTNQKPSTRPKVVPGTEQLAAPALHPVPVFEIPVHFLTATAEIEALADTLKRVPRFAVDMESDSFYHYFDKVCLFQITAGGEDYIVDALSGADLTSLHGAFADPAIEKIFHGADNDIMLLKRSCGIDTKNIFDTMIAAQVAGLRKLGLSDLIGQFFSQRLDKRFQRYDWSSRPLLPEHLQYARSDTHYLAELRDLLWDLVVEKGREAQALEEFERVVLKKPQVKPFSADDCLKIAGSQTLAAPDLKVLRELFIVRDQIAREEDLPTFRVIPNDALLNLVRLKTAQARALLDVRGMHPRVARSYGERIVGAIRAGMSGQAILPQPPPEPPQPENAAEIEARFQKLKKWRQNKSATLDLEPALVASNAILYNVARLLPGDLRELQDIPLVRRWQVDAYGAEWLATLAASGPA